MSKLLCVMNSRDEKRHDVMLKALSYNRGWRKSVYSQDNIFIACYEHPFKKQEEYWLETENFVVCLDGEILDMKEFVEARSITEKVLKLYQSKKEKIVDVLNGNFTMFVFDKLKRSLFVANDRLGLRPLYYREDKNRLILSSELKPFLADKESERQVNIQAVMDLFSYEYVLGNHTLIDGVSVYPYANYSYIDVNNPRIEAKRYWDVELREPEHQELTNEYLDRFKAVTQKAIDRTLVGNGRIGLPISGGLDSRIIGVMIKDKISPLHTFTFGEEKSEDVTLGDKFSRILESKHHYSGMKYDQFPKFMERALFFCDGQVSVNCYPYMNMMEEMNKYTDVGLDGFLGGVLPRAMYSHCFNKEAETIYKAFDTITLKERKRIFKEEYHNAINESKKRFMDVWQEAKRKSPQNPVDYLNITQRQRKYINLGKIIKRNYMEFRVPFADYDYMDFCLTMPRTLKFKSFICKQLLIKYYPESAQLPEAEKGMAPLKAGRMKAAILWRLDVLKEKIGIKTKPEFDFRMYYRNQLKEYMQSVLSSEEFKTIPLFNHNEVAKIVAEHLNQEVDHKNIIGALLTFALWYRNFMPEIKNVKGEEAHVS